MASCEKCWRDSGGDSDWYARLLLTRNCTPNEQAGGVDAGLCDKCGRQTVHAFTKNCMHTDCQAINSEHK